jgi:four helix bundle protein
MSRDHRKLRVFQQADSLVIAVYPFTSTLPAEERFGLQAQIRRSAVSVATNIVEGSARSTRRDYRHFLDIAHSAAREAGYLIDLSARLGFLERAPALALANDYEAVAAGLLALMASIDLDSAIVEEAGRQP